MRIFKNAVSGLPIPPGMTLREELDGRRIAQTAFARQISQPVQVVNEIVKGKKSITADTAIAFEKALGISAKLWLNLEASYQLSLARAALGKAPRRRAQVASRTHGAFQSSRPMLGDANDVAAGVADFRKPARAVGRHALDHFAAGDLDHIQNVVDAIDADPHDRPRFRSGRPVGDPMTDHSR
jgi:addiction module HigA family antidote